MMDGKPDQFITSQENSNNPDPPYPQKTLIVQDQIIAWSSDNQVGKLVSTAPSFTESTNKKLENPSADQKINSLENTHLINR